MSIFMQCRSFLCRRKENDEEVKIRGMVKLESECVIPEIEKTRDQTGEARGLFRLFKKNGHDVRPADQQE